MADRTFQTCTNCGQDLSIALTHLFWRSDCPQDFEYNCKACGAVLSIEVEPLPQFWVELKQRPTPRALDGATVAEFCECGISIESHTGVYCIFRPASNA